MRENFISEQTLQKFEQLVNEDKDIDKYNNVQSTFEGVVDDSIEDPFTNVLVHRPSKNFVWGLGQQTKRKKCIVSIIII